MVVVVQVPAAAAAPPEVPMAKKTTYAMTMTRSTVASTTGTTPDAATEPSAVGSPVETLNAMNEEPWIFRCEISDNDDADNADNTDYYSNINNNPNHYTSNNSNNNNNNEVDGLSPTTISDDVDVMHLNGSGTRTHSWLLDIYRGDSTRLSELISEFGLHAHCLMSPIGGSGPEHYAAASFYPWGNPPTNPDDDQPAEAATAEAQAAAAATTTTRANIASPTTKSPTADAEVEAANVDASRGVDRTDSMSSNPQDILMLANLETMRPETGEGFARGILKWCGADLSRLVVLLGKAPGVLYLFGLKCRDTLLSVIWLRNHHPHIYIRRFMGMVPTPDVTDRVTKWILAMLDSDNMNEISYMEISKRLIYTVTDELCVDASCLEEVRRGDFYGLARKCPSSPILWDCCLPSPVTTSTLTPSKAQREDSTARCLASSPLKNLLSPPLSPSSITRDEVRSKEVVNVVRATSPLLSGHIMYRVSLRELAPVVHAILESPAVPPTPPSSPGMKTSETLALDRDFLYCVLNKLEASTRNEVEPTTIEHCIGEREPKPLEYLVTCVPGIEVYWKDGNKFIRKLDFERIGSKAGTEESGTLRATSARPCNKPNNDAETKITKCLTSILRERENQYMTLESLDKVFRETHPDVPTSFCIRTYITEHVKFYQLLREGHNEVVTLSHRAQIKRVSNDIQRILRRRSTRSVSASTLPAALLELWQSTEYAAGSGGGSGSTAAAAGTPATPERRADTTAVEGPIDVAVFGVCYLDDLLVTIPQHWGIHCSVYVDSESGALVKRQFGEGEEDIPEFVAAGVTGSRSPEAQSPSRRPATIAAAEGFDYCPSTPSTKSVTTTTTTPKTPKRWYGGESDHGQGHRRSPRQLDVYSTVHAWTPRCRVTDTQRRCLAIFRQQLLNMYRGDPSAEQAKQYIVQSARGNENSSEKMKRIDTLCLRSNTEQLIRSRRRGEFIRPEIEGDPENRPHMPCDFQLHFNQFIPTFHHVYSQQATVQDFGAKTLFETFELMTDTFVITHHEPAKAKIKLTSEARREVLERRIVYLMRRAGKPLELGELIERYRSEPTMAVYFDHSEFEQVLKMSSILEICTASSEIIVAVKPLFCLTDAIKEGGSYVPLLLSIFMKNFGPLSFGELQKQLSAEQKEAPLFVSSAFALLLRRGALRQVSDQPESADGALFDVQDICRVVRNLIYQMNGDPTATYHLPTARDDHGRLGFGHRDERSLTSMLEQAGDCVIADFDVERVMNDFSACFFERVDNVHPRARASYRLSPCVIAGVPSPEERERARSRRPHHRSRPAGASPQHQQQQQHQQQAGGTAAFAGPQTPRAQQHHSQQQQRRILGHHQGRPYLNSSSSSSSSSSSRWSPARHGR